MAHTEYFFCAPNDFLLLQAETNKQKGRLNFRGKIYLEEKMYLRLNHLFRSTEKML